MSKTGVGKLWPAGQMWPSKYFLAKSILFKKL